MEDCIKAADINLMHKKSKIGEGGRYKTEERLTM